MSRESESPIHYAIRIMPQAARDIDAHTVRLAELVGADVARTWYEGLFEEIASLSTFPHKCPLIDESRRFARDVRDLLYRRTRSGPAWRILFTVDEGGDDGPIVHLLHVRHGSQRPISAAEARRIELPE